MFARGVAQQGLDGGLCIELRHTEQRRISMVGLYLDLLAQRTVTDAVRCQLRRPGGEFAQPRLHAKRRGDGVEVKWHALDGAAGGDRTHDPWLRRPILYPLSYSRC